MGKIRILLVAAIAAGHLALVPTAPAQGSLGDKLKKVFNPTPTPKPKKRRSTAKKSPSPKATASPKETASPREASPSPSPKTTAKSSPTSTPKTSPTASPTTTPKTKTSPSPKAKKKGSPSPSPSPSQTESPSPSPTPEETESPSPTESPSTSPSPEESPSPSPTSSPEKKRAGGVSISTDKIQGFPDYKPEVKRLVEASLELAGRDLGYKYGSADPGNGGMDCSGFIYYVLRQHGLKDVPRDSSQLYTWLRKAGKFEAVISQSDNTFELDNLRPGDLLFWTGTYDIKRDPPITHTMIYVGREEGTNRRIMVGASDGRTYQDEARYGVSVFDFKVSRSGRVASNGRTPRFVGYGHLPGLTD